jgi:signal transduction histidine kinase
VAHIPRLRLSLRDRLALFFFAVTLLAIAVLYLYVAPGLQRHLAEERIRDLTADARAHTDRIARTIGSSVPLTAVQSRVNAAGLASGDRVTLLLVTEAAGLPQLSLLADSTNEAATAALRFSFAAKPARTGRTETGIEQSAAGRFAEAALPIRFGGRTAAVVVFSTPASDIGHTVALVRHEILVAGGIAVIVALIGGYIVARVLTRRVKRLERAAVRVAAGDFHHRIQVDSGDELGQLAVAFNAMQRELEQLDLARKKFIATASHELRTPIFSLGGFVELLEDDELDADTRRRFLEQVSQQVERLSKLSVDLLDLSRLESGALELRPEHVDLGELTRSVSGEFEPTLAQTDSHIELRLAARHMEAQCDPVRVAQIMRILIDNALVHNAQGTRIVVTAAGGDDVVRIAVRDDGAGIDPAAQSRIFEPFFTADDAQGSGLGLAIASELAERMKGRLWVFSEPGGTTFTLELPAAAR